MKELIELMEQRLAYLKSDDASIEMGEYEIEVRKEEVLTCIVAAQDLHIKQITKTISFLEAALSK